MFGKIKKRTIAGCIILVLCLVYAGVVQGFVFTLSSEPVKGFVYYLATSNWSSKTVEDSDTVTIQNNATVTLDRNDTAKTLRIGNELGTGTLIVDSPFNLTVTDTIVNNGSITIDGGTLSNGMEGTVQGILITDRFAAESQSDWASNDEQIAAQIGSKWKRCNPADDVTQYRVSGGKLDIGAVSLLTQKASLVNTATETVSKNGGTGFRLSAVMQQDHTASSGFMGLIFNYQDDGSYYLFRVNGVGSVQLLVYSQFVMQGGAVFSTSEAFTPVQNRQYELSVESVGFHTFNLRIVDTVSGATVYSRDSLVIGGSYLKLDDGIGGVYATASSAGVDDFELVELPNDERFAVMDTFSDQTQSSWSTNDAQIARQIGTYWKRCNPVDEDSQYRIKDGKLDIGAQSSSAQRASLINTAVQTSTNGFRLSVVQQQNTTAGSASMGLIFNYQDDGSYYLFRVTGAGYVQFLVYSQYVQQAGTVFSTSAFTPVQNRPYKLCVESSEPYTFDVRVIDTVTGSTVYSNADVTVVGSFVQLQDGLGGVFVTHGLSLFDNFYLDAVPADMDFTLAGSGSVNVESGTVNLNGDTVSHTVLNSALFDVSGGDVSLGQVSVGADTPAVFRVTGDAGAIDLASLNQGLGGAESGTFRFVFDQDGISPLNVSMWADLGAAQLIVDGSAYAGGPDRFTLVDAEELIAPFNETSISVSGFPGLYEASVQQDLKKVELVYKEPDLFEEVTAATGLDGMANINWACWFDYNHDEWIDLAAGQHVWVNNGGTNFTDLRWVGNVVAADFDNDGWTDLFSHSNKRLFRNNQGTFEDFTLPAFPDPYSCQAAVWGDWNNDGWVDLYVSGYETPYFPNLLLINNGGQSFTMSTLGTGDASRGVTACDFDQDHDLDIYVSNYRLLPNDLWVNNGAASFSEQASAYNVLSTERGWSGGHSIGNCWGDFDNDGLFDLFSGNFSHRGSSWGGDGIQPESDFFRNRGPANSYTFEDLGTCGIYWQESYASPAAGDYDNDGRLDLYFTTAYPTATSGEANNSVLFHNESDFAFVEVDDESIAGLGETIQAAWGDYNNDGQLDLMTAGKLFRNRGVNTNSWLKVRLEGDGSAVNRSAIGAQVRIVLGTETLSRQVEGATGQGNQNDPALHFGLGLQTEAVDVAIVWPDGTTQTITGVTPNQLIEVVYGK
ncbi:MAG: CRTAC1 family protein [Kiritimatiellales bacterium]|nr:CRTAC1 family protein [Kiritimatiellales bacterium]